MMINELRDLSKEVLVELLTESNVKISSLEHEVDFLKNALTKIMRIAEEDSKLTRITKHVRECIYD